MNGANAEHPFADTLRRPEAEDFGQWTTLDEVERVLVTLQKAAPQRLEGKRRDFRALRLDDGLRGMKAELVFAAYLALHGVAFDFGASGTPQPDLVLRALDLGVEITTRKSDALWDLREHLARAMADVRPRVRLSLEFSARPFAIRSKVKEAITKEVRAAAAAGETEVYCVIRPAGNGHAAITLKITIMPRPGLGYFPEVHVQHPGPLLTPLMRDVEDELVVAMEDKRKRRQGEAMPTVLVVDLAHVSGAWLRSTHIWGKRLLDLIQPEHGFAALAIIVTSAWTTNFRFILGESAYAPPTVIESLRTFEQALGLTQFGEDRMWALR